MYMTKSCAFGANSNPETEATSTAWSSLDLGRARGVQTRQEGERHCLSLQRRFQPCPLHSSPAPAIRPVPSPVCPGPSAAPFPAAGTVTPHRDGDPAEPGAAAARSVSHTTGLGSKEYVLVFHPLIYRGLMVVSTIIPRSHIKSSLLLQATQ